MQTKSIMIVAAVVLALIAGLAALISISSTPPGPKPGPTPCVTLHCSTPVAHTTATALPKATATSKPLPTEVPTFPEPIPSSQPTAPEPVPSSVPSPQPTVPEPMLPRIDEYGMELKQVKPIKSAFLKQLVSEQQSKNS